MYDGNELFYPGSFVKVFVNLQKTENALLVPTECVIPTLKGQKVFVSRNGVATETMVTIGIRNDDKIQILSGINQGDTIVASGLLAVRNKVALKFLKSVN